MPAIIFDLDQTLIDSSIAKTFRDSRQWSEVYKLIPRFYEYDGISGLFKLLKDSNIKVSIVTSSPPTYLYKIIKYFGWKIDFTVSYFDTKNHKPHPEPIYKAAEALGGGNILSFGDDPRDIIASNAAGIASVACTWGTDSIDQLISAKPNFVCTTVSESIELVNNYFGL